MKTSTIREYQTVAEALMLAPVGVLSRAQVLAEERWNGARLRDLTIQQLRDVMADAECQLERYKEQ